MTDKPGSIAVIERLFKVIESRRGGNPETSYTASLFVGGKGGIAQKLDEETEETIIAALEGSPQEVARESADLLYHLLVLWAARGVRPAEVWAALEARRGVSGIAEKAARSPDRPQTEP